MSNPSDSPPWTANLDVQLYPHDAQTLLPLLAAYLPYSLGVYGSIVSVPSSAIPLVWATFPPDRLPSSDEILLPLRTDTADALPVRNHLNLPDKSRHEPHSPSEPSDTPIWTIITPYSEHTSHQTRIFNNFEHPSLLAVETQTATGNSRAQARAKAQAQVVAVHDAYQRLVDPEFRISGCVHKLWAGAVEDHWKLSDEERRGYCGAWIRRERPKGWPSGEPGEGIDGASGRTGKGFAVELGTAAHVSGFIEHTDIKRTAAYYTSRLPHSSVLLQPNSSTGDAQLAAQVLSHADGTIGSLFTYPSYRRQGLGAALVRAHIASGRGAVKVPDQPTGEDGRSGTKESHEDEWTWTHIYNGNTASEGVFRSLGFESLWEAAWIYRPDTCTHASGEAETEA